jgi:hypothetical protein
MTTLELRTSIVAELDQMSVEMLESVSHYVRRLRRHARPVRRDASSTATTDITTEKEEISINVGRLVFDYPSLSMRVMNSSNS